MSRTRCPSCGKRVPEGEPCCPRCGHSIPIHFKEPEEQDVPWGEADEEIDDPELLAQVEEYVKGLPNLPYQRRRATAPAGDARSVPPVGEAEAPATDVGECPFCGRQARKGWDVCPWCGATLGPEAWTIMATEIDKGLPVAASDDGIYDLQLLEQAEEYVKLLPEGLFRRGERPRMPVAGRRAGGADEVASVDRGDGYDEPAVEEDEEPEAVGSECPACGRQAQKGWTQCPWCGAALTVDVVAVGALGVRVSRGGTGHV